MKNLPLPVKILLLLVLWPYIAAVAFLTGLFLVIRTTYYNRSVIPRLKTSILEEASLPEWKTYLLATEGKEDHIPEGDPQYFLLFLFKRYLGKSQESPEFQDLEEFIRWERKHKAAILKANQDILKALYGKLWVRFSMGERTAFTKLVEHHIETNPLAVERFWPVQGLLMKTPWLKDQIQQTKIFSDDPEEYRKNEKLFREFLDIFFLKLVTSHASLQDPAFTAPVLDGLMRDLGEQSITTLPKALPSSQSRGAIPSRTVGAEQREQDRQKRIAQETEEERLSRKKENNTKAIESGRFPLQWIIGHEGRLPENGLEAFTQEMKDRGLEPFDASIVQELLEEACRQYPLLERRWKEETFKYFRGQSEYQQEILQYCAERNLEENTASVHAFFKDNVWLLEQGI